jgi:hypothetical protein
VIASPFAEYVGESGQSFDALVADQKGGKRSNWRGTRSSGERESRPDRGEGMVIEGAKIDIPACPKTKAEHIFAVRLTFAGIVKHLTARAGDIKGSRSMSLLTASIESTRLTRWNFGLGALTLLGVFAIALALILP